MPEISETQAAMIVARAIQSNTQAVDLLVTEVRAMHATLTEMQQRDSWVDNYRHEVETPPAAYRHLIDVDEEHEVFE